MRILPFVAALLFAAACGEGTPPEDSEPARMWSVEGLSVQPRLSELQRRVPSELGYAPGTTSWRRARAEIPAELGAPRSRVRDAGVLLDSLARALGWNEALGSDVWEQTRRLRQEDGGAVGVVLLWGFLDDALVGHDFRVAMRRGERGWYVEDIEERFQCRRGVSADGLCL